MSGDYLAALLPETVLMAVAGRRPRRGCGTAWTVGALRELQPWALPPPCCWLGCPCDMAMGIPLHQQAGVMQPVRSWKAWLDVACLSC